GIRDFHVTGVQTCALPILLGRIVADFLRRGIDNIRKETDYKAAVLYHALESTPGLEAFVADKKFRSKTVIVANSGANTSDLAARSEERRVGKEGRSRGLPS